MIVCFKSEEKVMDIFTVLSFHLLPSQSPQEQRIYHCFQEGQCSGLDQPH